MRNRAFAYVITYYLSAAMLCGCGGGDGPLLPTLTRLSAECGPSEGGTELTLEGSGFTEDVIVMVGASPATNIVVVSEASLTCIAPAGTAGAVVDVGLTTATGTATLAGAYRYLPLPELTEVLPFGGPLAGGTTLFLTGSGFDPGITSVRIGGAEAIDLVENGDSSCTCSAPAGQRAGSVDVVVTTAGGSTTLPDGFLYYPEPTLSTVDPDSGFESGGARLTLTGTGFQANEPGEPSVLIGGAKAADVVVLSDSLLNCTSPPGTLGSADVVLSNRNGSATLANGFLYFGSPTVLDEDVRLDTDPAGTADSNNVRICCDGKKVYAVWQDYRDGEGDIYFNRSRNGGASWLSSDVRIDTGTAGAAASCDPQIVNDGSNLYVVWRDNRNGGDDIYFNRSTDGGDTWLSSDVRLDTDDAGDAASCGARVCCDGDRIYVAWEDNRNGGTDIYFTRSTDGGVSWLSSDLRVNAGSAGSGDSQGPRLCCDGSRVYLAWQEIGNGDLDVYFNRSTDGGLSWLSKDVRLDTDDASAVDSCSVEICCAGTDVYAVWEDNRNGGTDIRFNRSTDGGASWMSNDVRLDTDVAGAADSAGVRVCCDGESVYVVWEDARDGKTDIRFNGSTDGGASWLSGDVRLDSDTAGSADSCGARVCCAGENVYVAWWDWRNSSQPDIYLNRSTDGGATWLTDDLRLDTDQAGSAYSADAELACAGARLYAVWYDERDGAGDVRFTCNVP